MAQDNLYEYSQTASSNTEVEGVSVAEGMLPGLVNNAMRQIMSHLAKFCDDMSGANVTGGSSNAYTLTSASTIAAYAEPLILIVEANHTNTGAATINVDSLGAKDIKIFTASGVGDPAANNIMSGARYILSYDASADDFYLLNPTGGSGTLLASNNLSDLGSASTARTNLGLAIGTDVQAYDAELAAIAGLTSAANKVIRFTGSGTAGLLDFLDEDTMSSDSATAVASQQSIKAYVDASIPSSSIIQLVSTDISAASGTTEIPSDTTAPGSTEGTEVASQAITPSSASNTVLIQAALPVELDLSTGGGASTGECRVIAALFRGTTCIAANDLYFEATGLSPTQELAGTIPFLFEDSPATTSATTYSIRVGRDDGLDAGTWYVARTIGSATQYNSLKTKNQLVLMEVSA